METIIVVNKGSRNIMPLCRQVNVKMQRILVVDDDKVIRDVLSTMLMTIGFGVDVASSGDEGLNLFRKNLFDLVVTDLKMPGMDGWTLSYYIKDEAPDTPVILITGLTWEHVKDRLARSCVDSVMFKSLLDLQSLRVLFRGCYQDGDKMMRTVIDRLVIKGMDITSIPNYIRDLAYIISFNSLSSLQGLNRRLQLLGWDDFELDEYTLQLILAAFELSLFKSRPVG